MSIWVIEEICKGGKHIAKTHTYRTRAEARRVVERLNGSRDVLSFVEYHIRKYTPSDDLVEARAEIRRLEKMIPWRKR